MKVTQLDGGAFTSAAGIWRSGESLGRMVRFPIPVYLIEVGEERILVDTGLNPNAAADAASHYDGAESLGLFRLEQEVPLESQVDLASLTKVVMTHLHFDHSGGTTRRTKTGGLEPVFKRAKHVIQKLEWEDATHPHERKIGRAHV